MHHRALHVRHCQCIMSSTTCDPYVTALLVTTCAAFPCTVAGNRHAQRRKSRWPVQKLPAASSEHRCKENAALQHNPQAVASNHQPCPQHSQANVLWWRRRCMCSRKDRGIHRGVCTMASESCLQLPSGRKCKENWTLQHNP